MIGQAAIIAIMVAIGGIAGGGGMWYLQHSAVEKCNAEWKDEIAEANLKLERANSDKAEALRVAEASALARAAETAAKLAESEQALEVARKQSPLPDACNQCLIPRERLFGSDGSGDISPDRVQQPGSTPSGASKAVPNVRGRSNPSKPIKGDPVPKPKQSSLYRSRSRRGMVVREED